MAYTEPPTRTDGVHTVTAADHNTYNRDNFIEVEARKQTQIVVSVGSVVVSAVTAATANTVVTAAAFTPNGTDRYRIEFTASTVQLAANAAGNAIVFHLYDSATNLGRVGVVTFGANAVFDTPVFLRHELTPTNASHTYSVRAHRTNANCTVVHGAGGADVAFPFQLSVTRLP